MTEHDLIRKEESLCLLEDGERCFIIDKDGIYMDADRMMILAQKMIATAKEYGSAIHSYNERKGRRNQLWPL